MTALTEFLFPAPARRSVGGIVRWWEARRLPYNLIVGGAGLSSLAAVRIIAWLPPDPPSLSVLAWQPIVAFGVLANPLYLLGPTVEIAVDRLWGRSVLPVGPALFRMGLTFSAGLALFPTLLVLIDWLVRILRWAL